MDKLKEQLRKEVECSLCIETIKNPKILPCHHGFCCECLNKMAAVRRSQGLAAFDCPECLAPFELPKDDRFDDFPSSFHHNRLLDLMAMEDTKSETTGENCCSSCEAMAIDYYCNECKICICPKCAIVIHKTHQLLEIPAAAQQHKNSITAVVDRIKLEIPTLGQAIMADKQNFKKVEGGILSARQKIQAKVEELIQVLKEHEIDLLLQLDVLYEDQQHAHMMRQRTMETNLDQMGSSVEYAEAILQRNTASEIINLKDSIVERCEGLLSDVGSVQLNGAIELDFVTDENLWQTVTKTAPGRITLQLAEQPSDGQVADGFDKTETTTTVATNTKYAENETSSNEIDSEDLHNQTPTESEVENDITSFLDYDVSPTPPISIGTGEEGLLTSSDRVTSPQYHPLYSFGIQGNEKGEFSEPYGVAVNRSGDVLVTDAENARVQRFTAEGRFLHEFGSGELSCPLSVAFNSSDEIIVVDSVNGAGQVSLFSNNGTLITKFASEMLKDPRSVSVASEGKVIICDQGDRRVKIFSPDGKNILNSFAARGCTECPCYACFHRDRYYVTFSWSHCIKVFDELGHCLYDIGRKGISEGKFLYPSGVVVDHLNNLIVCDCANNRIQAFTLEGEFLYSFGEQGSELGQFQHPEYAALGDDERMYVVERNNHRVQVFRGNPLEFLI